MDRNRRVVVRGAIVLAAIVLIVAVAYALTGHDGQVSPGPTPSQGAPAAAAGAGEPAARTPICGQPILRAPWDYTGPAGTYRSGTTGLPTFGSPGTDFPHATSGTVVPAGDNTAAGGNGTYQVDHAVIYFEPGIHTLRRGMWTGTGTAYVGGYTTTAGSAILDGKGTAGLDGSDSATPDETWEYLTIRNFGSDRDGTVLGNVNGAAFSSGNTYRFDTIGPNQYNGSGVSGQDNGGGYGISFYSNTTIDHDCLVQNSQGAFNGSGGYHNVVSDNEISRNGLGEYPDNGDNPLSCGCTAGGKLLNNLNSSVTGNWVHGNYNTGIWADFDNAGLNISNNYVAGNWGVGIAVEGSYNTQIAGNTLVGNGWASEGPWPSSPYHCFGGTSCTNGIGPVTGGAGGLPYSAIELDNSGGNANLSTVMIPGNVSVPGCSAHCTVTSRYAGRLLVQGNVLADNFGGVGVYTDTDRYPGNVDSDSACSVPLGTGPAGQQPNSGTYYQQTKELQTTSTTAAISGTSVTTPAGMVTVCGNYGGAQADAAPGGTQHAPSPGMAVFDMNAGTLLGTVAATPAPTATSFALTRAPGNATGVRLLVSAYGGCGPADYFGGGLNTASGHPAANYWDNCIWGSRNITVTGNTFSMNAASVKGCTTANLCGYMTAIAFNAGVPKLVQFFDAYSKLIARASDGLGNVWSGNTYKWSGGGPGGWQFQAGLQGNQITGAQWQASPYGQDAGSSFP